MTDAVDFDAIRDAHARIAPHILDTPCLPSRTLSEALGAQVTLKFENLQFTASFKERGACNKLAQLAERERRSGVVAMSAGNHAQGVAYHAQRLGLRAVIVMPEFTPGVKVERTRGFGAEVLLHGATLEQARAHALALADCEGLTLVHPYDDAAIIAGQGTVALEMLRACPGLDMLVVPVGGGGLAAGMAVAARHLRPDIEIVGVQALRFPSMVNTLMRRNLPQGPATIADGIAVGAPGLITQALLARHGAGLELVDEADIEQAIVMLLEIEKTLVEGAGAAGLAALIRHPERFRGRHVGIVLSGGNIDPLLLAAILRRGMVRAGRLARICVDSRDVPGSLARITALVAQQGGNIAEVHHQRAFTSLAAQNVEIELVLQTKGHAHVERILGELAQQGFRARGIEAHSAA